MKNRPLQTQHRSRSGSFGNRIVTEWEDNVLFDVDDPDFCNMQANVVNVMNTTAVASVTSSTSLNGFHRKVPTTMSLASVHGPQFADICSPLGRSSISMSSSLSDLVGSPLEISMDNVLTIEELRQHMGSCFTCGVSWTDDHVSLDCSECGGYSMERPCPLCDGMCGVQWKRDFTMSHACGKARWHGVCPSYPENNAQLNVGPSATSVNGVANASNPANTSTTSAASAASCASTQLRLAQELCARLEQLSSGSSSTTARF